MFFLSIGRGKVLHGLKPSQLLWLGTATCLIAAHFALVSRVEHLNALEAVLLPWGAVLYMLLQRRGIATLRPFFGLFSGCLGILGLLLLLIKISLLPYPGEVLFIYPLWAFVGLVLIGAGFQGLVSYRLELAVMVLLGVLRIRTLPEWLLDLSNVTAKSTGFLLWYSGVNVRQVGRFLLLDNGGVEVNWGCSGIGLITHLLCITLAFLIIFRLKGRLRWFLALGAILLGFGMNCIRVAIMVLLVAQGNNVAFEYWHGGEGAQVFSIAGMLVMLIILYRFIPLEYEESSL